MLDMLRYEGVTPIFVDMVPPSGRGGASAFDPSSYLVGFDNVLYFYCEQTPQGSRSFFRVLKSVSNDYVSEPMSIDWRRT